MPGFLLDNIDPELGSPRKRQPVDMPLSLHRVFAAAIESVADASSGCKASHATKAKKFANLQQLLDGREFLDQSLPRVGKWGRLVDDADCLKKPALSSPVSMTKGDFDLKSLDLSDLFDEDEDDAFAGSFSRQQLSGNSDDLQWSQVASISTEREVIRPSDKSPMAQAKEQVSTFKSFDKEIEFNPFVVIDQDAKTRKKEKQRELVLDGDTKPWSVLGNASLLSMPRMSKRTGPTEELPRASLSGDSPRRRRRESPTRKSRADASPTRRPKDQSPSRRSRRSEDTSPSRRSRRSSIGSRSDSSYSSLSKVHRSRRESPTRRSKVKPSPALEKLFQKKRDRIDDRSVHPVASHMQVVSVEQAALRRKTRSSRPTGRPNRFLDEASVESNRSPSKHVRSSRSSPHRQRGQVLAEHVTRSVLAEQLERARSKSPTKRERSERTHRQ